MYSEIVREPQFYLDKNESYYPEATSFLMTGDNLTYILSLLNSDVISLFFKTYYAGGGLGETGIRYKKAFLEKLPIPQISDTTKFDTLAKQIIEKKANKEDTKKLEKQIDQMVYKLYELSEEEIAFIEDKIR